MNIEFIRESNKFFVAVTLGLAAFLFWGTMNTTGFCWSKGRYLSDDEIFRGVVKSFYLNYGPYLRKSDIANRVGVARDQVTKLVPYETVDQFFEINQNCCEYFDGKKDYKMGHGGSRGPFLTQQFFGVAWATVFVKFKVYYIDDAGIKKFIDFGSETWSDACGKSIRTPLKYIVG